MDRNQLIERLGRYEWTDLEFKEARNAVPRTAYETVSAFANTRGGRLVFGVRDHGGDLEVVGVRKVDKVQNDFLNVLRSGQKLNRAVEVEAEVAETDGGTLLVFTVPESPWNEKPVYLDGDIRRSFVRRGGCNERCTWREIERFLRDASTDRYDDQPIVTLDAEHFFDPDSVQWYRRLYYDRNPGRNDTISDLEFLDEWGLVVEHSSRLVPTRAGVLLFGRPRYVRQTLPRPVIDCQFFHHLFDDWTADLRWHDRIVVEENLVGAWLSASARYWRHSERPFRLDTQTMRRNDHPPDYIAFREATINQLIHQDYGDHGRKASIRFFRDRTMFWNPGEAFSPTDELLDPTEKDVRNPAIVAAFRRIGLSEQAGTGVRAIYRNWRSLGYFPPVIDNDKSRKSFELLLSRDVLLDDDERRRQKALGLQLDDQQASVLAFAQRRGRVSLTDVKAVTAGPTPKAREVVGSLVAHRLLVTEGDGGGPWWPTAWAEGRGGERIATAQVDHASRPLTKHQRKIVRACTDPRSLAELMERAAVTHRSFFRRQHLKPLLHEGIIRMTIPDNPSAANQRYVLTDAGMALMDSWE